MAGKTGSSAPPRFRVGGAAIVTLLLAGALSALLARPESDGPREIGRVVGTVVGAIGLPLLVGWVVFRLGGRSAANPVIVVLALASMCGPLARGVERREAKERLDDKLRVLADSRASDDPAARIKAADEAIVAVEELGEADPGARDELQALAQMMRRMVEPGKELQALTDEFAAAGGVDAASLPTLAAIDARLGLVGRALEKAELLCDRAKNLVPETEAELRASGVNQSTIDGFLRRAREKAATLELTVQLRESDVRYFAACHALLTVLRARFGAWRDQPNGGLLQFDATVPESDIAAYNRAAEAISAEAATQERLAQQMMAGEAR